MKIMMFLLLISSLSGFEDRSFERDVFLTPNTRELNLFDYLDVYIDFDKNLSIQEISDASNRHFFRPVSELGNSFGFSDAVYWVRFSLDTQEIEDKTFLLELAFPLIDKLTFYFPQNKNMFRHKEMGDAVAFCKRDIDYRNFVIELPLKTGKKTTYYMRLESTGSIQIPLFLWTQEAFISHIEKTNFIIGGYYGTMFLLMLMALVAFMKVRKKLFIYYVFYISSFLIFQLSLNGFIYQYLLSKYPYANALFLPISVGAVVIGGLIFSSEFLQIWRREHKYLKLAFLTLMSMGVFTIVFSLFGDYRRALEVATITGFLLPPLVLVASLRSWHVGYSPARYFLLAWSLLLFGVFISGLLHLGYVSNNFFTVYSMQIGSTLEVILLGYAMFDQVTLLNKEKEDATLQANRYLNQINEGLEGLVLERTKELEEKNRQLKELSIHDSMTGLLNHNTSIEHLKMIKNSVKRYDDSLAVIMLDIDLFKNINDNYGHPAGDKVIISIADILKESLRDSDICGRYGGEEFILILDRIEREQAYALAERIRKKILLLKIDEIDNIVISASFGLSIYDKNRSDQDLILEADKALYQAKKEGRNKVVISS